MLGLVLPHHPWLPFWVPAMSKRAKKYTDEELSRILGEHAAGYLRMGGAHEWSRYDCGTESYITCGCVNQAAYNTPYNHTAYNLNEQPAEWFDGYYNTGMKPETLLNNLDKVTNGG